MKRKIIFAIVAIFVLGCLAFALVACDLKGSDHKNQPKSNISRRTDAYYAGESELFAVSIEQGKREKVFIADGKATDVEDFCQITVTPLASNSYDGISFKINGDNATLEGEVKSTDFGEYSATINLSFVPTGVVLTAGSDESDIELANVLDGAITSDDVVNIAKEAFKDKIEAELADGKAEREIYIKLITGDRTSYFYYVSFIGDGVDYWAMLVDPKTGDIVSKR